MCVESQEIRPVEGDKPGLPLVMLWIGNFWTVKDVSGRVLPSGMQVFLTLPDTKLELNFYLTTVAMEANIFQEPHSLRATLRWCLTPNFTAFQRINDKPTAHDFE